MAARGPGRAGGLVAWALGVWWIGEGAGGLMAGGTLSYTEAPGAALLYVLLAMLIWPVRQDRDQDRARAGLGRHHRAAGRGGAAGGLGAAWAGRVTDPAARQPRGRLGQRDAD